MHNPTIEWAKVSSPPELNCGEIHVWSVDLFDLITAKSELRSLLSTDEQERAGKFFFEKDRDNFVIRRGILRKLLGCYAGVDPVDLRFIYNRFGKPGLADKIPIEFNASSSSGTGVLAFTLRARIGIDIEYLNKDFPGMEVARQYFSVTEMREIQKLEPETQMQAFFHCWTRKEAYVKAVGEGMSHPLPDLTISTLGANSFSIDLPDEKFRWKLVSFVPKEKYISSIAYEGEERAIHYFRWDQNL